MKMDEVFDLRARVHELLVERDNLERENAALRAALDAQMQYQRELRADRDRLDWLDENASYNGGGSGGTWSFFSPADVEDIRAAIDAAMREDKP